MNPDPQAELVGWIWGDAQPDAERERALAGMGLVGLGHHGVLRGFEAYRENAKALAVRALGAAYPRVVQWVGPADFPGLAWAYARHHPPREGDLNRWGGALADFLDPVPDMDPELPALARLDWALHRCVDGSDEEPSPRLRERLVDEADGPVRLSQHLRVLRLPLSGWTTACAGGAPEWAEPRPEVVVWRAQWRPCWSGLPEGWTAWLQALAARLPLGEALQAQKEATPGFDGGLALQTALARGWILDTEGRCA